MVFLKIKSQTDQPTSKSCKFKISSKGGRSDLRLFRSSSFGVSSLIFLLRVSAATSPRLFGKIGFQRMAERKRV